MTSGCAGSQAGCRASQWLWGEEEKRGAQGQHGSGVRPGARGCEHQIKQRPCHQSGTSPRSREPGGGTRCTRRHQRAGSPAVCQELSWAVAPTSGYGHPNSGASRTLGRRLREAPQFTPKRQPTKLYSPRGERQIAGVPALCQRARQTTAHPRPERSQGGSRLEKRRQRLSGFHAQQNAQVKTGFYL